MHAHFKATWCFSCAIYNFYNWNITIWQFNLYLMYFSINETNQFTNFLPIFKANNSISNYWLKKWFLHSISKTLTFGLITSISIGVMVIGNAPSRLHNPWPIPFQLIDGTKVTEQTYVLITVSSQLFLK
jgi:hypothetical protein